MWICERCGEKVDEDFDVCWNCKSSRDGVSPENQIIDELPSELKNVNAQMSIAPDSDLLQIVNVDFRQYREEAVLLARAELERRNIPMNDFIKLCPKCKAKLDDGAPFCSGCGTSTTKPEEKVQGVRQCHVCDSKVEDDAKFCPECRAPVAKDGVIECPNCQTIISDKAKFCKNCANEIIPSSSSEKIRVDSQKTNSTSSMGLVKPGLFLAITSGIVVFWGRSYTSDWQNVAKHGFGSLVGQDDSTYQIAQFAIILGSLGLLVGIILFIVGLAQKK